MGTKTLHQFEFSIAFDDILLADTQIGNSINRVRALKLNLSGFVYAWVKVFRIISVSGF